VIENLKKTYGKVNYVPYIFADLPPGSGRVLPYNIMIFSFWLFLDLLGSITFLLSLFFTDKEIKNRNSAKRYWLFNLGNWMVLTFIIGIIWLTLLTSPYDCDYIGFRFLFLFILPFLTILFVGIFSIIPRYVLVWNYHEKSQRRIFYGGILLLVYFIIRIIFRVKDLSF